VIGFVAGEKRDAVGDRRRNGHVQIKNWFGLRCGSTAKIVFKRRPRAVGGRPFSVRGAIFEGLD
jgi:hypothetical protein